VSELWNVKNTRSHLKFTFFSIARYKFGQFCWGRCRWCFFTSTLELIFSFIANYWRQICINIWYTFSNWSISFLFWVKNFTTNPPMKIFFFFEKVKYESGMITWNFEDTQETAKHKLLFTENQRKNLVKNLSTFILFTITVFYAFGNLFGI
jgi:hypothetical protein